MCKKIALFLVVITVLASCGNTQVAKNETRLVGGLCEGCEAVFEFSSKGLTPVDTLPGFKGPGMKIKVAGVIYNRNGTPAKDVILYVYHERLCT